MDTKQIYNKISPLYDTMYSDEQYTAEDQTIRDILLKICRGAILDIGCWTGYTLDQLFMDPVYKNNSYMIQYDGVDLSDGMIETAKRKYGKLSNTVTFSAEDFMEWKARGKRYDTIVSTFASMSYMDADSSLNKVLDLAKDDALVMLMYYGPDRGKPDLASKVDIPYDTSGRPSRQELIIEASYRGWYMYGMDGNGKISQIRQPGMETANNPAVWFQEKRYIITNFPIDIPKDYLKMIYYNKRTFAKTYADFAPHEYLVYGKVKGNDLFRPFVGWIREHWYMKRYGKKSFTYLNIGKRCYWSMGAPVEETTIINRAITKD